MSSMFDGLFIARSGVRASRVALNITGQNITNANTDGYTRQRVDQSSLPPSEYGGEWSSSGAAVGNGTSVDSISQLRDEFLDSEFRTQNSKSGESSTQVSTLYDMEDIFTSTTTASSSSKSSVINVLNDEFSNFLSQLQNFSQGVSNVSESTVRDAASSLATKLNIAAKALETTRDQQYTNLTKYGVNAANGLLKNIASLNKQIKDAECSGSSVLELQDQRNLMLDKLSKYVPIKVNETPAVLANGKTVDTMSVYLADADGNQLGGNYELIGGTDGNDFAEFTVSQDPPASGKSFGITQVKLTVLSTDGGQTFGADTAMANGDIKGGTFSGYLKLLNESGEYDTALGSTTSTFRGIGFYSQYLDTIAQNFASTLNTLNFNASKKDSDNNAVPVEKQILLSGSTDTRVPGDDDAHALDDIAKGVTAKNIHVAAAWQDGVLATTKDPPVAGGSNKASFSNILVMIGSLTNDKISLNTSNGISVFTGSLQSAFSDVSATLAQNTNSLQSTDNTNSNKLNNINSSRQAISSVSLDDEAVSIVQFSQSLNASSRFMTAVDECLQNIINNMGLAGRG